jgi:hypothetical protein
MSASLRRRARRSLGVCVLLLATLAPAGAAGGCTTTRWVKIAQQTFKARALFRSQGVTSDGSGWIFSWQGGLERTDDRLIEHAVATWPPGIAVQPQIHADGTNHIGGNHIGDIDVRGGLVYAPIEDGGEDVGPITLNDPEYQRPYIALYDAKTLLYTGRRYLLPLRYHEAGVPWVAVNGRANEVYTAEWDMPHDRINVFRLNSTTLRFKRFITLHYPAELGAGFHLSRIQGAKVLGDSLYASRDDDRKSVFRIDLATGEVSKVFSLDPGVSSELEGIAVRRTPDGAVLHLLIVLHGSIDFFGDTVAFEHFAPRCA